MKFPLFSFSLDEERIDSDLLRSFVEEVEGARFRGSRLELNAPLSFDQLGELAGILDSRSERSFQTEYQRAEVEFLGSWDLREVTSWVRRVLCLNDWSPILRRPRDNGVTEALVSLYRAADRDSLERTLRPALQNAVFELATDLPNLTPDHIERLVGCIQRFAVASLLPTLEDIQTWLQSIKGARAVELRLLCGRIQAAFLKSGELAESQVIRNLDDPLLCGAAFSALTSYRPTLADEHWQRALCSAVRSTDSRVQAALAQAAFRNCEESHIGDRLKAILAVSDQASGGLLAVAITAARSLVDIRIAHVRQQSTEARRRIILIYSRDGNSVSHIFLNNKQEAMIPIDLEAGAVYPPSSNANLLELVDFTHEKVDRR